MNVPPIQEKIHLPDRKSSALTFKVRSIGGNIPHLSPMMLSRILADNSGSLEVVRTGTVVWKNVGSW